MEFKKKKKNAIVDESQQCGADEGPPVNVSRQKANMKLARK
jgi:hypothetical protein